jgi:hypothetical protein
MNRSFKPCLDTLHDRMLPAIAVPLPPPADTAGALVAESDEPEAATIRIVCADHVVKGERPK